MTDISDAYESAYTIMLNLNKTWITKQGDFFVESPIILLAAIIWYLKIYKDGKFCTFPHAIELLNKRYADLFVILTSYPALENYLSPFMDAWRGGAQDQLQGQIASAKIPLSRMISPQLYWIMSGDDFTLDINKPQEPKVLCIGNNPDRKISIPQPSASTTVASSVLSTKKANSNPALSSTSFRRSTFAAWITLLPRPEAIKSLCASDCKTFRSLPAITGTKSPKSFKIPSEIFSVDRS